MNIENNHIRITTACFLGGSIGALLALQFVAYFWWVGVLMGGGIGYLMYNLKEVCSTAQKVWKAMPEKQELFGMCHEFRTKIAVGFLSSVTIICATIIGVALSFSVMSSLLFVPLGLANVLGIYLHEPMNGLEFTPTGYTLGTIAATLAGYTFSLIIGENKRGNFFTRHSFVFGGILLSPIGMFVTIPLFILSIVVGGCYLFCRYLPVLCKLISRTFKLIHSDIRLLCMTDSLIGATAGCFMGNALLGGLIGVVSGLLNYELVSVRWLKLAVRVKKM